MFSMSIVVPASSTRGISTESHDEILFRNFDQCTRSAAFHAKTSELTPMELSIGIKLANWNTLIYNISLSIFASYLNTSGGNTKFTIFKKGHAAC